MILYCRARFCSVIFPIEVIQLQKFKMLHSFDDLWKEMQFSANLIQ